MIKLNKLLDDYQIAGLQDELELLEDLLPKIRKLNKLLIDYTPTSSQIEKYREAKKLLYEWVDDRVLINTSGYACCRRLEDLINSIEANKKREERNDKNKTTNK